MYKFFREASDVGNEAWYFVVETLHGSSGCEHVYQGRICMYQNAFAV